MRDTVNPNATQHNDTLSGTRLSQPSTPPKTLDATMHGFGKEREKKKRKMNMDSLCQKRHFTPWPPPKRDVGKTKTLTKTRKSKGTIELISLPQHSLFSRCRSVGNGILLCGKSSSGGGVLDLFRTGEGGKSAFQACSLRLRRCWGWGGGRGRGRESGNGGHGGSSSL